MMNKKRLAVLAMSAVMTASSVSIPVNAADFSDGAGAQVAAETFSADVDTQSVEVTEETEDAVGATVTSVAEKEWKNVESDTPSLVVTVTNSDGSVDDVTVDKGFEKQTITATCTQEGGYKWSVTYLGETFMSDFVKTADKTDHNYVQHTDITTQPTCTTDGKGVSGLWCSVCHEWKDGTKEDVTIPASHTFEGEPTVTYEAGDNTQLVNGDNTVVPELINKAQKGSYTKVTTQKCKVCGEVVKTPEVINVDAEEIVRSDKIIISDLKNITSDLTAIDDVKDIPDEEKIVLKDCTKDGSYVITYLDGNGDKLNSDTVTVKAHHMMKVSGFDYVNEADKESKLLSVEKDGANYKLDKDGHLIVVNNTCLKDVEYYEISNCTACGKNEVKEKKVAAKSTKHVLDKKTTAAKATVDNYKKAGTEVKYSDLINNANIKDNKYVKIVPETATCEKAGTVAVEFYCQVCGEKSATVTGVKVGALGHSLVTKSENVVEATCQSAGSYDAVTVCERCGKETSRKNVVIKRLAHTNETEVATNGQGTPNKDSIKGSDASIQFVGSLVFGPYTVGQTIADGKLGTTYDNKVDGTVVAKVVTNCATCHNNEVVLDKNASVTVKAVKNESMNAVTGKVTAPGSITLAATYTEGDQKVTKEITLPYFSEEMDTTLAYTGLHKDVDGIYRYYVDGDFAEDYAGLVTFDGKEFFVANGVLCKDAHGLNLNAADNKWYFLAYGQVQDYTGLALYDGEWFYITDGKLDESVSGLVDYDGGTFLFVEGRLAKEANGLCLNAVDNKWYFMANGQLQKQYTGVAMYDNEFFYIVNGVLDDDYNGTVEYDGETFKVVNGMLQ